MTSVILDTHIALWWLADDRRLTARLQDAVRHASAVYVSSASTWEVAIKLAIGRLKLDLDPGATFASVCAAQGFNMLAVDHDDAWAVLALPPSRTDPFDRLIAATARRRGFTVATADTAFDSLDVPTVKP